MSYAELTRRTGAAALSKTLRQRRLRIDGHALRMANPSTLTILLRFLQPGLRRRRVHARTLTLHQNIIDDISAINQSVKSMTSASKSYFSRIVATLSTTCAFNIYIHTYIYTCMHAYTYICTHSYTCMYICAFTQIHVHTHTYTYMHVSTHIHTLTHTYIYIYVLICGNIKYPVNYRLT